MEPDEKSLLARTIDAWRANAGEDGGKLTLEDLAFEARKHGASKKLTGSTLSKILAGDRPYDTQLLAALAHVLGHDPNELPHYQLAIAIEQIDAATDWSDAAPVLARLRHIEQLNDVTRRMADRFLAAPRDRPGTPREADATEGSPRSAGGGTTAGEGTPEP